MARIEHILLDLSRRTVVEGSSLHVGMSCFEFRPNDIHNGSPLSGDKYKAYSSDGIWRYSTYTFHSAARLYTSLPYTLRQDHLAQIPFGFLPLTRLLRRFMLRFLGMK